jgi:hypothetical protein
VSSFVTKKQNKSIYFKEYCIPGLHPRSAEALQTEDFSEIGCIFILG